MKSISDNAFAVVTRILIVEDFAPHRVLVCSLLGSSPELRVVGEASDGLEAIAKAQELEPDLLLMDISLPGLNGIEAALEIRKLVPASKIIFLTQESSSEVVEEAIRLGASGYVFKSEMGVDLLRAIQAVLQGKQFFSRGAVGSDSAHQGDQKPPQN